MNNALSTKPSPSRPSKPTKDGENRGDISEIHIGMTENCCEVRCGWEPDKIDPKQDRYSQQPKDEKFSFDDMEKAKAYVTKMMDQHPAAKAAAKAKPVEKKTEAKAV